MKIRQPDDQPCLNEKLTGEAIRSNRAEYSVTSQSELDVTREDDTVSVDHRPRRKRNEIEASIQQSQLGNIDMLYQHRI